MVGSRSSAAADEIRSAALETLGGGAAEPDGGHQRGVDVAPCVVDRARGGHGVVEPVPQVGRGVGVNVGQVGDGLSVGADLRHPRVEVVHDPVRVGERVPNRSPSPVNAWAAALSVALSLTGSTCSEISITVSKRVLNSVVTDDASMTSRLVMRCGLGSFGELNAMYLLPKTVVALTSAMTFLGMKPR